MDASILPYLIVRRPILSWCTRALSCALVRLLQSLAKDPRRAGVSRVSLKPPLHGPASVVCSHSSRACDGWARAPTCSCVAPTVRHSNVALRRRHTASISSSAFSGNCRQIASPITSSFAHPRCALLYTGLPGRKHTEAHPRPPWQ